VRAEDAHRINEGALKFIKGTIYKPYFTDPVPAQPNKTQQQNQQNTTAKPTNTLTILPALPDSLPRTGF